MNTSFASTFKVLPPLKSAQTRGRLTPTRETTRLEGAHYWAYVPPAPLSDGRPWLLPTALVQRAAGAVDLSKSWESSRIVQVGEGQLADAVQTLIRHHSDIGFYGERLQGMQRLENVGRDGELEIQLCPNRKKTPVARKDGEAKACALCSPPFAQERGLRWKDYVIWPNAFPYVPTNKEHVVITSAQHRGQGFDPGLLADMITYQGAASVKVPVTLHYNGLASNSQFHLHWQASRETLPLQNWAMGSLGKGSSFTDLQAQLEPILKELTQETSSLAFKRTLVFKILRLFRSVDST